MPKHVRKEKDKSEKLHLFMNKSCLFLPF